MLQQQEQQFHHSPSSSKAMSKLNHQQPSISSTNQFLTSDNLNDLNNQTMSAASSSTNRIRSNSCINQLNSTRQTSSNSTNSNSSTNNNNNNINNLSLTSISNSNNNNIKIINGGDHELINNNNNKLSLWNNSNNYISNKSNLIEKNSFESSISENSTNNESLLSIANTTTDSSFSSSSNNNNSQDNKYLTTPLLSISSSSTLSSSSSSSSASSFATTSPHSIKNLDSSNSNLTKLNNSEDIITHSNNLNDNNNKKQTLSNQTSNNSVSMSSTIASTTTNSNNSPESYVKSFFSGNSLRESSSSQSYKKQKENYLTEKKRITNDMLQIMRDERIIVLADWLKVRGSLKNWIKLYAILKPGIMLLFKSDKMKSGQWVGTIILNSCQLLERPSKKHGFCFKLFHPLERSIWASKGPAGETYINVPYMLLPTFYLIFRAPSEKIGNIWMEAIELTLKSSHLIKPSLTNNINSQLSLNIQQQNQDSKPKSTLPLPSITTNSNSLNSIKQSVILNSESSSNLIQNEIASKSKDSSSSSQENVNIEMNGKNNKELSDSDNYKTNSSDDLCSLNSSNNDNTNILVDEYLDNETNNDNLIVPIPKNSSKRNSKSSKRSYNHNNNNVNDDKNITKKSIDLLKSASNSKLNRNGSNDSANNVNINEQDNLLQKETIYVPSSKEEFGELGNKGQTEEVGEEDKSLIFHLVKQVRPGMDLSKVVLPTFILEPRSFLEKLTDYYYHSDILSECINNDDPYQRMKSVVKFYLSGFYKKPKGLKKPYNPILGEVFRSCWYNPKTDSKTFYVAEQVSHHPPITAFYVTNRKEGFCIYGTILARSKFYGNSVSAIMEGNVRLVLLNRGEEYVITLPYANCKGILIGKLTMELGGKVNIECAKTGYSAEIDFKLKPLLGGIEASNLIDGKIKFAKETMAVINGKWDGEILLNEKKVYLNTNQSSEQIVLWKPTKDIIESRLKRYVVPIENQMEFESEKLWLHVSAAIKNQDQNLATEEKTKIELRQREAELERRSKFIEYKPKFFTYDSLNKEWIYNYSDTRPWDPQTDLFQIESEFKIFTKTKHKLKVKSIVADPRTSLITFTQHGRSQSRNHHADEEPNSDESSYNLLVQYNEIKDRLHKIEDNLKHLNEKFESTNTKYDINYHNQNSIKHFLNDHQIKSTKNNNNDDSLKFIIMVAVFAWFIGILSATFLFQKRYF